MSGALCEGLCMWAAIGIAGGESEGLQVETCADRKRHVELCCCSLGWLGRNDLGGENSDLGEVGNLRRCRAAWADAAGQCGGQQRRVADSRIRWQNRE